MKHLQQPHVYQNSFLGFWILAAGNLLLNFFLKTFKKKFFCPILGSWSWQPRPTREFWERSDGTFWAIATKILQKPHFYQNSFLGFWILAAGHLLIQFLTENLQKKHFLSKSWVRGVGSHGPPLNFGNNQMVHSGPLQRKTWKNHMFTKIHF